jgi:hypothetical protein
MLLLSELIPRDKQAPTGGNFSTLGQCHKQGRQATENCNNMTSVLIIMMIIT